MSSYTHSNEPVRIRATFSFKCGKLRHVISQQPFFHHNLDNTELKIDLDLLRPITTLLETN